MKLVYNATAALPTRYGDFTLHIFTDPAGHEHMALATGDLQNGCLVRLHSECATGDILGSMRCDCRDQLETSLKLIAASGNGMAIYLRGHEGRGIGLANKVKAYALQDTGMDTVDANQKLGFKTDQRDYTAALGILRYFGLTRIRLLTNNTAKLAALTEAGITVEERLSIWTAENPHNSQYLATKRDRMRHVK